MNELLPVFPVYYKYHTCYPITDPNARPTTLIRCGPGLYSIIKRYWTKEQLWKFDSLMHAHGFNTMNEQNIETVFNQINDKELYNQTLDEFKEVHAEYKRLKNSVQYDEDEIAALKKHRNKLCKIVMSVRARLTKRDPTLFNKDNNQ